MIIPASILKRALDNQLGEGAWKDFETETLILELDLPYSDVLFDKLSVLKVVEHLPNIFFDDMLFMLHSAEVLNSTSTDFEFVPHITSLEMAFAIIEMASILGVELHKLPEFNNGTKTIVKDILINEGYSEVLPPFDVVGVGELHKGQTERDTSDKAKAIEEYIHIMYRQGT